MSEFEILSIVELLDELILRSGRIALVVEAFRSHSRRSHRRFLHNA